jgi:hypothetical protein
MMCVFITGMSPDLTNPKSPIPMPGEGGGVEIYVRTYSRGYFRLL